MKQINYSAALTGSGKSTQLLNDIAKSNELYLVAVPSIKLTLEQGAALEKIDSSINPYIINSATPDTYTGGTTTERLRATLTNPTRRVVITTHATLQLLFKSTLDLSILRGWNLVIDEKIDFFSTFTFELNEWAYRKFDDVIEFHKESNGTYSLTIADHNRSEFQDIVSGKIEDAFLPKPDDDSRQNKTPYELIEAALSPNHGVYITDEDYKKYIACDREGTKRIYPIAVLNPTVLDSFRSVNILSSHFDKTVSYKMLSQQGFTMKRQYLENEKTYHEVANNLTIHYFQDKNWTSARRTASCKNGGTVGEKYWDHAVSEIQGEFIYHVNKELREKLNAEKGTLLIELHGVNSYQHITSAVFLSALNASPDETRAISIYGVTQADLNFERNALECYQFVSRTGLRDPNNNEDINVYVPDRRCADFLLKTFPGAVLSKIDLDINTNNKARKAALDPKEHVLVSRIRAQLKKKGALSPNYKKKLSTLIDKYGEERILKNLG